MQNGHIDSLKHSFDRLLIDENLIQITLLQLG